MKPSRTRLTAEERIALADKISCNRREFVEASRRLSAAAPVMRIPAEILIEILQAFVALYHEECWPYDAARGREAEAPAFFNWIKVTHVCSYWRKVALGAASLWTHLKVVSMASLEALLPRSGQLPLHIEGALYGEKFKRRGYVKQWERVFRESARIERLVVHMDYLQLDNPDAGEVPDESGVYPTILQPLAFGRPKFPNLKVLELYAKERHGYPLPPFIRYAGPVPNLISLTTALIPLEDVAYLLSPRIKHLSVTDYLRFEVSLPNAILLEILASMPFLETLELDHTIATRIHLGHEGDDDFPPSDVDRIVELPNLTLLKLGSTSYNPTAAARLLNSLDFPPQTMLRMSTGVSYPIWEATTTTEQDLAPLQASLSTLLSHPLSTPIRALRICGRPDRSETSLTAIATPFVIERSTTRCSLLDGAGDVEYPRRDVPLRINISPNPLDGILRDLPAKLPLAQVEALSIAELLSDDPDRDDEPAVPYTHSADTWRFAFGQMLSLRAVCVAGGPAQHLPEALLPAGDPPIALFPSLEVICFHGLDNDSVEEHEEWIASLCEALQKRKEMGMSLKYIHVHGCPAGVKPSGLAALADEVDWVVSSAEENEDDTPEESKEWRAEFDALNV